MISDRLTRGEFGNSPGYSPWTFIADRSRGNISSFCDLVGHLTTWLPFVLAYSLTAEQEMVYRSELGKEVEDASVLHEMP